MLCVREVWVAQRKFLRFDQCEIHPISDTKKITLGARKLCRLGHTSLTESAVKD